jgi:acetyl-CoA carboxylase alpha subunit
MMALKTPVVTILIGEGGSGGALALGVPIRYGCLKTRFIP